MSDLHDEEPEGATPLTPEEREGLIPAQVTLRRELNEIEQQNILEASLWVSQRRHDPVSNVFGRGLHRRMFGKVWRWAGDNRASNKNIGCDWWEIDVQLRGAFADTATWIEFSPYPSDEIAVRFHHRLVAIHPFANGNGRWSRMMGDALARRLGHPSFSWGNSCLLDDDATRSAYIDALRTADRHDIRPLLAFARS